MFSTRSHRSPPWWSFMIALSRYVTPRKFWHAPGCSVPSTWAWKFILLATWSNDVSMIQCEFLRSNDRFIMLCHGSWFIIVHHGSSWFIVHRSAPFSYVQSSGRRARSHPSLFEHDFYSPNRSSHADYCRLPGRCNGSRRAEKKQKETKRHSAMQYNF